MDSTMLRIQQKLDLIMKFLTPLLPLANCHMVEYFTDHHWERLVPEVLAKELQNQNLNVVIDNFWDVAGQDKVSTESKMAEFVSEARFNSLTIDNEICLSVNELEAKIKQWGGHLLPEIYVKEFMNSKKCYEVQTMSRLVASLQLSARAAATHCVDAGGGRGQLPALLALGYGLRGLTVDCDSVALDSGKRRERLLQKQWHAIAKKENCTTSMQNNDCRNLHKYVNSFVTKDTDLSELVKNAFPEHTGDVKLLLTGLHTCGNLGPASLRLFATNAASAVFNVPCCYHLLTEAVDDGLWSIFEKNYGERSTDPGFPMSEYMTGVVLGRNARMLAAQSVQRAASQRRPPPRSLLHRAVLQVIIKEHLQLSNIAEGKLKRISSKCQTLREYVEAADEILKLGLYKLDSDVLEKVFSEYEGRWEQLVVFYLLRLCLAQVIESAILLDRLLYVKECGFEDVFLVRLFDPVLSPRCHAIVAIR